MLGTKCSKATSLGKVRKIVQVQKAEEAALAEAKNQVAQTRPAAEAAKIVQAATTTLQTEVEEDFMLMQIPLPGERQTPSKMTVALQQAARTHPEEVLEALNKRRKSRHVLDICGEWKKCGVWGFLLAQVCNHGAILPAGQDATASEWL